jgi:TPR repeat protein
MYSLGAFNASGRGLPKNISEAIKWYKRAADKGNASAMAGLAAIYASGDGVEPDREYAQELLDQADYCGLDVSQLREKLSF